MRIALALLCAFVASCASSSASIEKTWKAPDLQPGELGAVATMFVSEDDSLRRISEERMATALRSRGIRAVPSYTLLGLSPIDRDEAAAKLKAADLDGVVMMRIVSAEQQVRPVSTGFFGPRGMAWTTTKLVPESVVQVETRALSLKTNRTVWSSLSRSTSPEDLSKMIGDVTQVVSRELDKQQVILSA